jgi:uncharacterized protein
MKHFTFLFLILLLPLFVNAQITLYGRFVTEPVNYVTDQAGVLAQYEEDQLNDKLRNFEDSTSNQLFIYVAESLRANDLEDFSREIFNKWGIGQKDKNNGILIAIFIDDRKYRIQIGYGLEATLPSELCKQIQDEFMGPHFKQKNYYEGINAGVDKLIYYTRHEYKPPTAFEKMQTPILVTFLIGLVIFAINLASLKKWNNQPKRKQKYLLLGVSFLGGAAILTVIAVFVTESPYAIVPLLLGVFAEILLCTVINDKDDIKYDNESDNEYDRRMLRQRSRSSNDSSSDSFSGGGGGRSGSGGSSSSW